MPRFPSVIRTFAGGLFCLLSSSAAAQFACTDVATRHTFSLEGEITDADFATYIELPFDMPAGVRRLDVTFDYDRSDRTTIDLGLLDANGFRGWSGGNKSEFFVTANAATPSYSSGPIDAGTWNLLLGVPNIRKGVSAAYSAEITLQCLGTPDSKAVAGSRGRDWYVGDLHAHSAHSDGSCGNDLGTTVSCPAALSVQTAAERGLDFIALTEHNAVSHHAVLAELQAFYPKTLLLAGREVTTFFGHANAFGATEFVDFRLQQRTGYSVTDLQSQVRALGGLLSINHPGSPSGEDCMGCGWVLPDTDYSRIDAIEVVNTGFVDMPRGQAHLAFWHDKLNQGHRITGIGGSDNHTATRPAQQPSAIGNPRTWIFAEALSEAALLEGIRAGNVAIDVSGGQTKLLSFEAAGAVMGGTVSLASLEQGAVSLALAWESSEELEPRWTVDGNIVAATGANSDSSDTAIRWQGSLALTALVGESEAVAPKWLRVDLMTPRGATRLIGNPIYFDP